MQPNQQNHFQRTRGGSCSHQKVASSSSSLPTSFRTKAKIHGSSASHTNIPRMDMSMTNKMSSSISTSRKDLHNRNSSRKLQHIQTQEQQHQRNRRARSPTRKTPNRHRDTSGSFTVNSKRTESSVSTERSNARNRSLSPQKSRNRSVSPRRTRNRSASPHKTRRRTRSPAKRNHNNGDNLSSYPGVHPENEKNVFYLTAIPTKTTVAKTKKEEQSQYSKEKNAENRIKLTIYTPRKKGPLIRDLPEDQLIQLEKLRMYSQQQRRQEQLLQSPQPLSHATIASGNVGQYRTQPELSGSGDAEKDGKQTELADYDSSIVLLGNDIEGTEVGDHVASSTIMPNNNLVVDKKDGATEWFGWASSADEAKQMMTEWVNCWTAAYEEKMKPVINTAGTMMTSTDRPNNSHYQENTNGTMLGIDSKDLASSPVFIEAFGNDGREAQTMQQDPQQVSNLESSSQERSNIPYVDHEEINSEATLHPVKDHSFQSYSPFASIQDGINSHNPLSWLSPNETCTAFPTDSGATSVSKGTSMNEESFHSLNESRDDNNSDSKNERTNDSTPDISTHFAKNLNDVGNQVMAYVKGPWFSAPAATKHEGEKSTVAIDNDNEKNSVQLSSFTGHDDSTIPVNNGKGNIDGNPADEGNKTDLISQTPRMHPQKGSGSGTIMSTGTSTICGYPVTENHAVTKIEQQHHRQPGAPAVRTKIVTLSGQRKKQRRGKKQRCNHQAQIKSKNQLSRFGQLASF